MTAAPAVIERVVRRAPFGVRFRDVATGRTVSDGLDVTIVSRHGKRVKATRTSSGAYAGQGLPGLRAAEFGEASSPPVWDDFRIEVRDLTGSYHAFWFPADLPFDGLFYPADTSPLSPPAEAARWLPLFSTPARTPPPGLAVVRAALARADGHPAAWAALEVRTTPPVPVVRGIADARGEIAVFMPYPEPLSELGSPAGSAAAVPLSQGSWRVQVDAFLPTALSPPPAEAELPELSTFLHQAAATLQLPVTPPLQYGRDLVLGPTPLIVTPS